MMPKATKKSKLVSNTSADESQKDFRNEQEPLSENEFQEDCNILHESSSDDPEVFFLPPTINKQEGTSQAKYEYVYAIHRGTSHGLDC